MVTATKVVSEMLIMSDEGDTKIIWDKDEEDEVDAARATFDDLKGKGYLAYEVKRNGRKGDVLHKFNAKAEKIILAPRMVGG